MFSRVIASICLLAAGAASAGPIVIAHRGASGYLPEHTLEAYAYAHALGADYIEPDLVRTKDGAFIALHDIHLEATTDVEEVFPDRKREDGRWYAADFTLAEIRRLRVHERLPRRFPQGRSDFRIPTFEEVIELVQGLNASTGRETGIYPELKDPGFHAKAGLAMEEDFLRILAEYGYTGPNAKVFVQCFEPGPLKKMRGELGSTLPQIQLISDAQGGLLGEEGLARIAEYANGIGPDKGLIEKDPAIVQRAHAKGLLVHPYTIRRDMKPQKYEDTTAELRQFYFVYGVDGLFTDFSDDAVQVLRAGK